MDQKARADEQEPDDEAYGVGVGRAGEVGVDSPVASFVRVGNVVRATLPRKSRVIEFAADGTEAGLDVAKTLTVRQLSECHRQILIPTGQVFQIAAAALSVYALLELLVGKELDQLTEDGAPSVHPALSLFRTRLPRTLRNVVCISNRSTRQPACITLDRQGLHVRCGSFSEQQ